MLARFYTAPPQQALYTTFNESPAMLGMDGTLPLNNMPAGTAVYLYNLIPSEYGCRTREGYKTWAQNLSGNKVHTIVPFPGVPVLASPALFAVTVNGIMDVTVEGVDTPPLVVTFTDQTDAAGYGSYTHFIDASNRPVVYLADSRNGLYKYSDPGGGYAWAVATGITGPTINKIAHVMSHKGRLWFVERESANAWYLPTGAETGTATLFQFGAKFAKGGYLVGLYNWSIDGGDGLDDYLLAVSSGGDVLAYRGSDPSTASTWALVGRYYVGAPPEGRRIAYETGGDTLLLSSFGLTSVSNLLNGVDPSLVERNVTGKITRVIREDLLSKGTLAGWEVVAVSEDGLIVVNTPTQTGERHIQYVLSLNRVSEGSGGGWGMWRDLPANCFESWQGRTYFGTETGEIQVMRESLDQVDINGSGGTPVTFSMLGRFSDLGAPGIYKQVHFLRPQILSRRPSDVSCKAVYDFQLEELPLPLRFPSSAIPLGRWDLTKWDNALWVGLGSKGYVCGNAGYGRNAAIAVQGTAQARLTLLNIEGAWEPWDFL